MIRGNLSDQLLKNPIHPDGHAWDRKRTLRRLLLGVVFACMGFGATCFALRLLIHNPLDLYAEIRSEKLALAARWAGRATAAAFGSSHVDCGFDPRAFDAAFGSAGGKSTSLNLAVAGGSQIEQTAVAEEFEQRVRSSPAASSGHILLLEANSGVNFIPKFMTHPRAINIYDLQALRLALQFSDPQLGKVRALGRSLVALLDYFLHSINIGMLSSQIFSPALNAQLVEYQTANDRRGLSPPPPSPIDASDAREVHALMASLKSTPVRKAALITPGLCTEATRLAGHGASGAFTVIYFVTPKLTDLRTYETYPASISCGGLVVPIVNVALPESFPELYDPMLWHDINHLNERGAGVYSRLLGHAVAALQARPVTAP